MPTSTLIRSIPENSTVHFAEEAQRSLHMMGSDPSASLVKVDPSVALGGPRRDPPVDPMQCKHPLRRSPQLRSTPNLSRSNSLALSGFASQGTAMDPVFSDNLITALTEALEQHELQQVQQGCDLKMCKTLKLDAMPQTPQQSDCRKFKALWKLDSLWGCCADGIVAEDQVVLELGHEHNSDELNSDMLLTRINEDVEIVTGRFKSMWAA